MMNTKKCLICKRPNDTIYWHSDEDTGAIWCWCSGRCQRGYSLREYCHQAGIDLTEFLKGDFDMTHAKPNEISRLDWQPQFLPLSDPRAARGVEYIKSRGLEPKGDMYFDTEREGIVFPYYYESIYVGSQTRLIEPWTRDNDTVKVLTQPGTRLGLVFYNWNQSPFVTDIKGVIVCEGAFNAISLQQSLDKLYGGVLKNPWKAVATSGCGTTEHQIEKLLELKEAGVKIVCAFDSDDAGLKGLSKLNKAKAITHYAVTGDTDIDWNDVLKLNGHRDTATAFLKSIKPIF
jgi:hypothetical protein